LDLHIAPLNNHCAAVPANTAPLCINKAKVANPVVLASVPFKTILANCASLCAAIVMLCANNTPFCISQTAVTLIIATFTSGILSLTHASAVINTSNPSVTKFLTVVSKFDELVPMLGNIISAICFTISIIFWNFGINTSFIKLLSDWMTVAATFIALSINACISGICKITQFKKVLNIGNNCSPKVIITTSKLAVEF